MNEASTTAPQVAQLRLVSIPVEVTADGFSCSLFLAALDPDPVVSGGEKPDCRFDLTARALRAELARGDALRKDLSRRLAHVERRSRFQRCAMAIAAHDLSRPLGMVQAVLSNHARECRSATAQLWTGIGLDELARVRGAFEDLAVAAGGQDQFGDPVAHVDVSLRTILAAVAEDWRFFALAKGLSFEVTPSTLRVRSDPMLLRAVLDNLVSNAIRHTSAGGVRLGCRRRGGLVRIDVLDTGPGLDPQRRAFLDAAPAAGVENVGSGLAIVREASALMRHGLCVQARAGSGTRVSVSAPRAG